MTTQKIYYHFTGPTLRDGRPVPPIGEWLTFEGLPIPCECGQAMTRDPAFLREIDSAVDHAMGPYPGAVEAHLTGCDAEWCALESCACACHRWERRHAITPNTDQECPAGVLRALAAALLIEAAAGIAVLAFWIWRTL